MVSLIVYDGATGIGGSKLYLEVIDQVDPDYIVPIHIEGRDWFAGNLDNVILVDEGQANEF